MHTFYVYLNTSENKLMRSHRKYNSDTLCELLSFTTSRYDTGEYITKAYCIGYIVGATVKNRPINDLSEFSL